ncbi:hypothetical protein TWF696_008716 [Orbilia brochopaga]|uniref:C2H2-type domain-containing protein n=1 Tax=Orbilia brochopaga TaxID=3140254 RepID=A0AAV9UK46_9PEZI
MAEGYMGVNSPSGLQTTSEIRMQMMAQVPTVISTRIPPREVVDAGHLHHGTDDIVAYYCPCRGCGYKFNNQKDRLDHARWRHAWCWECNRGFETLKELDHFCVPTCQEVFDRPSRLIEHIERDECNANPEKRISEHWLAHAIILDYAAAHGRSDADKIYISKLGAKCITLDGQTGWIADPLGRFYDVAKAGEAPFILAHMCPVAGENGATAYVPIDYLTCLTCGDKWGEAVWYYDHMRTGADDRYVLYNCGYCEAGYQWLSEIVRHYENGCPYAERMRMQAVEGKRGSGGMVDIYVDEEDQTEDGEVEHDGEYED